MSAGWTVTEKSRDRHVIPNFGRKHEMTDDCWCVPKRDAVDAYVVVHWSHEPVAEIKPTRTTHLKAADHA